jgi:hypothetical protein
MAIPTLKHQIQFVDTIVVMKAVTVEGGRKYRIEDVLKSTYANLQAGELVRADLSIFDLLGYRIQEGQGVIGMLAIRKNLLDYDCIDFLPVNDDSIIYAKDDQTLREQLTVEEFRSLVNSTK